jgi:hypothetical protein
MARRWSQSGMRAVGALTGLGVIAARRVAGAEGPPVAAGGPLAVAAVVGCLRVCLHFGGLCSRAWVATGRSCWLVPLMWSRLAWLERARPRAPWSGCSGVSRTKFDGQHQHRTPPFMGMRSPTPPPASLALWTSCRSADRRRRRSCIDGRKRDRSCVQTVGMALVRSRSVVGVARRARIRANRTVARSTRRCRNVGRHRSFAPARCRGSRGVCARTGAG